MKHTFDYSGEFNEAIQCFDTETQGRFMNNKSSVVIDYFLGDDLILSFSQTIFDDREKLFDNIGLNACEIVIDGYKAVAFEYETEGYAIIWTDGEYYYQVCSTTIDKDELIKVASSVR